MPHALSMFSMSKDLTNTMHYCLPTVCAECQTRWGAYCILQPLHKPNLVSFVSESMTPIATGYIQLCASTAQAMHNCPLNFPHKKVLSTAKYGLQRLRKPSTHGFRAKKPIKPNFLINSVVINHNK